MDEDLVLYVYKCTGCGLNGNVHLAGDSHDGEKAKCEFCGADVSLEWDGGVTFDVGQQSIN